MQRSAQPIQQDGPSGVAGLTLVEASQRLRLGDLTSEDYATALLQACREQSGLNAFITIDADAVLEDARRADLARVAGATLGPLHGVPMAIKDNINTRRLPTSGGTAALKQNRPARDAAVIERLQMAGAIVLGKTNLHELAMGWTGNNPSFGQARNPHAAGRIAGGSSGGSAAAVAALMAPAAIGTDTNGSIRIPASFCGVVGLRPSLGRYLTAGIVPLAHSLDTIGPMARTVEDIVLLDAVMGGRQPDRDTGNATRLRVGISPEFFLTGLDAEIALIFESARRRLSDHGVDFIIADMPDVAAMVAGVTPCIIHHEVARSLPQYLAEHAPTVSMQMLIAAAGPELSLDNLHQQLSSSDQNYRRALVQRDRVREAYRAHFQRHHIAALMHPVTRMPAPATDTRFISPAPDVVINDRPVSARDAFGTNVAPASLAGCPVLVLPAGLTADGLPVGLSFEALPGHDDQLLNLGLVLEDLLKSAPHAVSDPLTLRPQRQQSLEPSILSERGY